jgi:class 3 adenylate cyclase
LFAEGDPCGPGDEAGVSQVALLFSDLQGSTALYERVATPRLQHGARAFRAAGLDRARP